MTLRTFQDDTERTPRNPRLNLLLSYRLGEDAPVMEQLPRLLSPMGIQTVRVTTAQDAAEAITVRTIHIAVVDLTVPFADAGGTTPAAGPSPDAGPASRTHRTHRNHRTPHRPVGDLR